MSENLFNQIEWIQGQIAEACERSGRSAEDVKLVAVTKKKDVNFMKLAMNGGLDTFGESRIQEAKIKVPMLPNYCDWHFIGPIQSNKIRDIAYYFKTIHSIESREQLDEFELKAKALGKTLQVLIQVNIGKENRKHGVNEEDAEALVVYANEKPHLEVIGLMTVAPFYEDLERVRPYFARMRELKKEIEESTGFILPELSMGMSYDFREAIEEGATMVRVGRLLFSKNILNQETDEEDKNGDL